jgi:hypothetical protein
MKTPALLQIKVCFHAELLASNKALICFNTGINIPLADIVLQSSDDKKKEMPFCILNKPIFLMLSGAIYFFSVLVNEDRLWSSGQSSWLQIQRSGFDFRRYQIF